MSLKDVNTKATALESKLGGKMFLGGARPSAEDVKAFNDLLGNNNVNLYRWVKNVATFSEGERNAWGAPVKVVAPELKAPAAAAPAAKKAPAAAPKKAEKKPAPAAAPADDDDIDLFGEATEEETAALAAKKAADAENKKKKVVIGKSSILFDVKPWDEEVDLEALCKKLHAIQRDGLLWGDHKLVPVAFGVKKLQMLVIIEDDKISGDDLEEMVTSFEDEVQSMDIVAWNKV